MTCSVVSDIKFKSVLNLTHLSVCVFNLRIAILNFETFWGAFLGALLNECSYMLHEIHLRLRQFYMKHLPLQFFSMLSTAQWGCCACSALHHLHWGCSTSMALIWPQIMHTLAKPFTVNLDMEFPIGNGSGRLVPVSPTDTSSSGNEVSEFKDQDSDSG